MAIHQPLDFEYWLVNVFAGSAGIFFYIAIACIFWMGAKFRMPSLIIFAASFLFVLIMAQAGLVTTGIALAVLILFVIVIALIIYAVYARMQK